MKHAERLWAIIITDDRGKHFAPIFEGITTSRTKAQCQKMLRQWRGVGDRGKVRAKVVRVNVQET